MKVTVQAFNGLQQSRDLL